EPHDRIDLARYAEREEATFKQSTEAHRAAVDEERADHHEEDDAVGAGDADATPEHGRRGPTSATALGGASGLRPPAHGRHAEADHGHARDHDGHRQGRAPPQYAEDHDPEAGTDEIEAPL